MGLNDQVSGGISIRTARSTIFTEGVKAKYVSLKHPTIMRFRILPAFDFRDYNNVNGWLPFILPEGQLTDWANLIYVARFVGHGRGRYSNRLDILSMQTGYVGPEPEKVFCPLKAVIKTIDANKGDWGYMMDKNADERIINFPVQMMLCNIIELSGKDGVQVGVFPSTATVAMFGSDGGLAFRRTMVDDATLAQNYLLGYEVNDMTNPQRGPVLACFRLQDKGEFSGYSILMDKDNANRPYSADVSSYLAYRARIYDLKQVINMPTEESIVQSLIAVLNGRSPNGHHEYDLLRMALPQFKIPASPQAQAASNSIQAGFGVNPAGGIPNQQLSINPQQLPFNQLPGLSSIPYQQGSVTSIPNMSSVAPVGLPQAPVQQPVAQVPLNLPQMPVNMPQAPAVMQVPTSLPQMPVNMPQAPVQQSVAVQAPVGLPQLPTQAPAMPQMPSIPHNLPLPQVPTGQPIVQPSPSNPVAPGDQILVPVGTNFTRESFLNTINSAKGGAV